VRGAALAPGTTSRWNVRNNAAATVNAFDLALIRINSGRKRTVD